MKSIIGKNMKLLREANRFSQEHAASFLGIERSTYSNYESGIREIKLTHLEKLAHLFGCELNLFFEEDESVIQDMLICTFRMDQLPKDDLQEIASFKELVLQYLKMKRILAQ